MFDGRLAVSDYLSNGFLNPLNNFLFNSNAGLLFADSASGDVLQSVAESISY